MKNWISLFAACVLTLGITKISRAGMPLALPPSSLQVSRADARVIKACVSGASSFEGIPSALISAIKELNPSKPEQRAVLAPILWPFGRATDIEDIRIAVSYMQSVAASEIEIAQKAAEAGDSAALAGALMGMDKIRLSYAMYLPAEQSPDVFMDRPRFEAAYSQLDQKWEQLQAKKNGESLRRTAEALGTPGSEGDAVPALKPGAKPRKNELTKPATTIPEESGHYPSPSAHFPQARATALEEASDAFLSEVTYRFANKSDAWNYTFHSPSQKKLIKISVNLLGEISRKDISPAPVGYSTVASEIKLDTLASLDRVVPAVKNNFGVDPVEVEMYGAGKDGILYWFLLPHGRTGVWMTATAKAPGLSIQEVKEKHQDELFAVSGVNGVGIEGDFISVELASHEAYHTAMRAGKLPTILEGHPVHYKVVDIRPQPSTRNPRAAKPRKSGPSKPEPPALSRAELLKELRKRVAFDAMLASSDLSTAKLRELLKTIDTKNFLELQLGFYFKTGERYVFLHMLGGERLIPTWSYHRSFGAGWKRHFSDPVRRERIARTARKFGLAPIDPSALHHFTPGPPEFSGQPYFPSLFAWQKSQNQR